MRRLDLAALLVISLLGVVATPGEVAAQQLPTRSTPSDVWPKSNKLSVSLTSLDRVLRALPPNEQAEQFRDSAFAAAFMLSKGDPAYRRLFFAESMPLRRPYLSGLVDGTVGEGRIAALDPSTYLLLLPRPGADEGEPFDETLACRLLDERYALDGRVPAKIQVVLYELDLANRRVALDRLSPVDGQDFYTIGRHGYVEAKIAKRDELAGFLAATDDLLGVRTSGESVIVSGRKYSANTFKRPYRRLDLVDVLTIRKAYRDGRDVPAEASELGFSLDPWIESKPVIALLAELLDRHESAERKLATLKTKLGVRTDPPSPEGGDPPKGLATEGKRHELQMALDQATQDAIDDAHRERIKAIVEVLKTHDIFQVPESRFAPGADLYLLPAELGETADGMRQPEEAKTALRLRRLAEAIRRAVDGHQVSVARYDGGHAGTEVGMTLFYCDILGKLWSWGQVDGRAISGTPSVPGFLSRRDIRPAAMHWPEILRSNQRRFWWGLDPKGLVVEKRVGGVNCRLCPVSTRLFIKGRGDQFGLEQEPDILVATALDSWNRRYLAIADREPEFHRLNQIMKWAVVFKALPSGDGAALRFAFLDEREGPGAAGEGLWFESWYSNNLDSGRLGVRLPVKVRRFQATSTEAVERFKSGLMSEAGQLKSWVGGVSGPSKKEVEGRTARKAEGGPTGLPGASELDSATVSQDAIRYKRADGRETSSVAGPEVRIRTTAVPGRAPRSASSEIESRSAAIEISLPDGQAPVESAISLRDAKSEVQVGRLAIERLDEEEVAVTWDARSYERAYSLAQLVAEGSEPEAGSFIALRYSKDGERVLFRLPGEDGEWLELSAGGSGGGDGGGDDIRTFAIGNPDGPSWKRGRIRRHAEVIADPETIEASKPRYVTLEVRPGFLGFGHRVAATPVYLRPPAEASLRLASEGAIHLCDEGRLVAEGGASDRFRQILPDGLSLLQSLLDQGRPRTIWAFEENQLRQVEAPGIKKFSVALPFSGGLEVLVRDGEEASFSNSSVLGKVGPETVVRLAFSDAVGGETIRAIPLGEDQAALRLPPIMTEEKVADATAVISALNGAKDLLYPLMRYESLSARVVQALQARRASLREAVTSEVRIDSGLLTLHLPDGAQLSVNEALKALNDKKPLPEPWTNLSGKDVIVDLGGIDPSPDLVRRLPDLAKLDRRLPDLRMYYRSGVRGEQERLQGLINWRAVTIANDTTAIDRGGAEWVSRISKDYLNERSRGLGDQSGSIRVYLDHFDRQGEALAQIRKQALAGGFRGQHLILGMCDPTRDTVRDFLSLGRDAIKNGALSVTFPDGPRDGRALLLAIDRVIRDPAIRKGVTPQDLLPPAYETVRLELRECLASDSPEQAVRERFKDFGADRAVELFFDRPKEEGGKFNKSVIQDTIDRMGKDADAGGWLPVVIRQRVLGDGEGLSGQERRLSHADQTLEG